MEEESVFATPEEASPSELMEEGTKAASGSSSLPSTEASSQDRAKKWLVGGGIAGGLAAIILGSTLLTPLGGSWDLLKAAPSASSSFGPDGSSPGASFSPSSTQATPQGPSGDSNFWEQPGNQTPLAVPAWQNSLYSTLDQGAAKKAIVASTSDQEFSQAANRLPSEADGYTNDASKATVNGKPNTMYSYWTAEEYQYEVGSYLARILNPTYGGWKYLQYASNHPAQSFKPQNIEDMFTSQYLAAQSSKPYGDWVPFYADWRGNDYGMGKELLAVGPRWYGQVVNSTSVFRYDDNLKAYTVHYTAQVKYTAWAKDQSKLEKTGTLTLEFVPNVGVYASTSPNKVLINSSTLKVN